MHPFFYFVAVVPAGEETELLVGLQNEGNDNLSFHIFIYIRLSSKSPLMSSYILYLYKHFLFLLVAHIEFHL